MKLGHTLRKATHVALYRKTCFVFLFYCLRATINKSINIFTQCVKVTLRLCKVVSHLDRYLA